MRVLLRRTSLRDTSASVCALAQNLNLRVAVFRSHYDRSALLGAGAEKSRHAVSRAAASRVQKPLLTSYLRSFHLPCRAKKTSTVVAVMYWS